jgi:hypothetical protein
MLKYPLPPEGQPSYSASYSDDLDSDPDQNNDHRQSYNSSWRRNGERDSSNVRYWQEGWYVWMTKNRWAAQEKMDLMMLDLEKQTAWQRSKEQEAKSWAEEAEAGMGESRVGGMKAEEGHEPPAVVSDEMGVESAEEAFRQTYLNATYVLQGYILIGFNIDISICIHREESFLVRIPTRIPVNAYTQQALTPTRKVLGIVRESFESGAQKELALRAWQVALDGAPFTLVKNVVKTCMESFKGGPHDDQS